MVSEEDMRGETGLCAVVTGNASYSISPQVHNAGYRALGLDFLYLRCSVGPAGLAGVIQGFRAIPNFRGLSVGTPHKLAVMQHLAASEIDEAAQAIGAVNTVVATRSDEAPARLLGTNTDWYGIERSLKQKVGSLRGLKVAVIGASGAARAAVFVMKRNDLEFKVFNLPDEFRRLLEKGFPGLATAGLDQLPELLDYDVIIHATPVGMSPGAKTFIRGSCLRPGQVVLDCVYSVENPITDLLATAEARGATTIAGVEMFYWQATEQFRLFTGNEPPLSEMRAAIPTKFFAPSR